MKDIIKKIFKENWDEFLDKYGERTRKVVKEEVEKMMKCGSTENGYIKIKCPECGNESKRNNNRTSNIKAANDIILP